MKINYKISVFLLFCLLLSPLRAQYNGYNYSINVNFNYTTTSKLYLQPKSSDELLRGIHSFLDKISGFGVEFRAKISDNFFAGLSAEYISKKGNITPVTIVSNNARNVLIEDGYKVIPLELTGYYVFPFSLKNFKFFMGGGIGYYLGSHIRNIGDISTETVEREAALGIHISFGFDVMVTDFLSVRGTMKFRDVDFTLNNKYSRPEGTYEGTPIQLLNENFDSKVVVDGITFGIGAAFHF